MSPPSTQSNFVIAFVVVAITVVGFFVGLQSPMNPELKLRSTARLADSASHLAGTDKNRSPSVVPATHYREMPRVTAEKKQVSQTNLADLRTESRIDPAVEIVITEQQKRFALAMRDKNRAFNGAPPTVPHPVDQMSSQACMVCHQEGAKTDSLRISKMSHQYLENCSQCHVEADPQHMVATTFRRNTFVGLPAPQGGPRAFPGAPPMIPHSTWMRVECNSCHGTAGQQGIRTTHPWRKNCLQCHAPSSSLDQVQIDPTPQFLPPLKINN